MEQNNDPSKGSGTNKSPNVKELSDEQLKQVAGGRDLGAKELCGLAGCREYDKNCNCTKCEEGWGFSTSASGVQICVLSSVQGAEK